MSAVLRVRIGERWPQRPAAAWALLGAAGLPVEEGQSEAAHWPPAEVCELVLAGAQCVWLHARVPKNLRRAEDARLIANALEDQLVDDPARYHPTVTGRSGGDTHVLVVMRERLKQVLNAMEALGRPASRVYSELQAAPFDSGSWHLALGQEIAILTRGAQDAVALDLGEEGAPPPLLRSLIEAEREARNARPTIVVHAAPGVNAAPVQEWHEMLHAEVRGGPAYLWHEIGAAGANLLHGEFVPTHSQRAWLARVRPALWVAATAVLLDIAVAGAEVVWNRFQIGQLERRTAQMFVETFPGLPVIDPVAQTGRQLDALRGSRGLLRRDDAIALLAALAEVMGAEGRDAVQELRFDDGGLQVGLSAAMAARLEPIRAQLEARGFAAGAVAATGAAPRLTIGAR